MPVFVCLSDSVCLSVSKITKKACMDLHEMLRVDRCRDMDELINFEPDPDYSPDSKPDCFLRYRLSAATRNFASGKSHVYVLAARRCSEAWF